MSADGVQPPRGVAATEWWETLCKDCIRELGNVKAGSRKASPNDASDQSARHERFEYSGEWADRILERGQTRSDRCPRCRLEHRQRLRAYSVAYVDITAIGHVADAENPTGPLGGLGPLPTTHKRKPPAEVDLSLFEFGLRDEDIVRLLDGLTYKRVAVLEAGTGTGKSTFGPFRLMKPPDREPPAGGGTLYTPTDHGPIVVTEPRVPATTGVARFVGETLCFGHDETCSGHIGPGFPVGYQKQGEKFWDDACRLVYVTDGTMINWIRDGRLAQIGMVIVDEAHERSENIDLILALLRDQLPRHPHLRVVIASATIDKDFFVEYFGGAEQVHYERVEAAKGVGYGVPFFPDLAVDEEMIRTGLHLPELSLDDGGDAGAGGGLSFEPWPKRGPDGEDLHEISLRMAALASTEVIPDAEWLERMPGAVAAQVLRILDGTDASSGDVLAFLPTKRSIQSAASLINAGLRGRTRGTKVFQLLSSEPDDEKRKALAPSQAGERKVVLSSNLAETSLTVSGVRFIVDSGLICQSDWNPEIARASLPSIPHSRSGVRQRWGRVGRDQPGWVFPLYTTEQFWRFSRETPPGSTRANLEHFVIKLKAAGIDRPDDIALPANFSSEHWSPGDPAGERAAATFTREISRAQQALLAGGAVDGEGHLTALGREVARFRGTAEQAMAIMNADRLGCVPEVSVGLTLLSASRLVSDRGVLLFGKRWPPSWRIQATRCHRALALGCTDDLELVLKVYAAWEQAHDSAGWARRWWVNNAALVTARDEARKTVEMLSPGAYDQRIRFLEVTLVDRARAAVARALSSSTYVEDGAGVWKLRSDPSATEGALDELTLTRPRRQLVALSRYQRSADSPALSLGGVVEVPQWMTKESLPDGSDSFDLLVARAAVERDLEGSSVEDALRRNFPVGSVVNVRESAPTLRHLVERLHDAPDPGPDVGRRDGDLDGDAVGSFSQQIRSSDEEAAMFDLASPPPPGAEAPEEELKDALEDVREPEDHSDLVSTHRASESPGPHVAKDLVDVQVRWAPAAPPGEGGSAGVVVGYEISEGEPRIVLEHAATPEPYDLAIPDLPYGTEVDLIAGHELTDHDKFRYRVFKLKDGGVFIESEMTGSLDRYYSPWWRELPETSRVRGTVVPGFERRTRRAVTPLPFLAKALHEMPAQRAGRTGARWFAGTIVGCDAPARRPAPPRIETGQEPHPYIVQLDHPDEAVSRLLCLRLDRGELPPDEDFPLGTRIEIQLRRRPFPMDAPPDAIERIAAGEQLEGVILSDSGEIVLRELPMSSQLRASLLKMDSCSEKWERTVWDAWVRSHRVSVVKADGLAQYRRLVELRSADSLTALQTNGTMGRVRRDHGVEISFDLPTRRLFVRGDAKATKAAVAILENAAGGAVVRKAFTPADGRSRPEDSTVARPEFEPGITDRPLISRKGVERSSALSKGQRPSPSRPWLTIAVTALALVLLAGAIFIWTRGSEPSSRDASSLVEVSCRGLRCTFTHKSSPKDLVKRTWTFGDGAEAQGRRVSHQFEEAGRYTVRLEVVRRGSRRTISKVVIVGRGTASFPIKGPVHDDFAVSVPGRVGSY